MIGLDGIENQRPPVLITAPTVPIIKFWSTQYSDLKFLLLASDTDYEFVVMRRVDGTVDPYDLVSVLSRSLADIENYLDVLVVNGDDPPGDSKISRLYVDIDLSGTLYRCMPRAYLYQVASALGAIEPV